MARFRTDYVDDQLNASVNTRRKYNMVTNDDGTVSFIDVTDYLKTGDDFGANEVNEIHENLNSIGNTMMAFFDPDRVLQSNTIVPLGETVIYTATEDCYAVIYLLSWKGEASYAYVNGKPILSSINYDETSAIGYRSLIPLKKGQVLSVLSGSAGYAANFTIYGMLKSTIAADVIPVDDSVTSKQSTTVKWDTTYCLKEETNILKRSGVVEIALPSLVAGFPTNTLTDIGTIPDGYRPSSGENKTFCIYDSNNEDAVHFVLKSTGVVSAQVRNSAKNINTGVNYSYII